LTTGIAVFGIASHKDATTDAHRPGVPVQVTAMWIWARSTTDPLLGTEKMTAAPPPLDVLGNATPKPDADVASRPSAESIKAV